MKLKSFFNKLIPANDKKTTVVSPPAETAEPVEPVEPVSRQKKPPRKRDKRIENVNAVGEIDVYVNNEKTTVHTLAAETRIGRDPSLSDIIISELIISKLHCTVYAVDTGGKEYFVKDNDSTNGVFVNHERVTADRKLENGDEIMLGRKGTVKLAFHRG